MYLDGTYAHAPSHAMPKFPCVIGVDGAGVIEAVGTKVRKWKKEDKVAGVHNSVQYGTWGEFAVFEESEVCAVGSLDWKVAGALPLVGLTALKAFECVEQMKVKEGHGEKSVVIHGASGGIGSVMVLLAKQYYAFGKVVAVCSGKNAEYCKSLGADMVVDYTTEKVEAAVTTPVDLILDNVGGEERRVLSLKMLKPEGSYVTNVPGEGLKGGLAGIL